jgi:hypothetical protein
MVRTRATKDNPKTRTIVLSTCVQASKRREDSINKLQLIESESWSTFLQSVNLASTPPFYLVQNDHGVGRGFKRAHRGVECPSWRAVSWELAQGRKRRLHFLWRLKMSLERLAIHHSWPPPFYLVQSITLVGNRPPWFLPLWATEKKKVQWDWLEKTKRKSRFKQNVQNAVTTDWWSSAHFPISLFPPHGLLVKKWRENNQSAKHYGTNQRLE